MKLVLLQSCEEGWNIIYINNLKITKIILDNLNNKYLDNQNRSLTLQKNGKNDEDVLLINAKATIID